MSRIAIIDTSINTAYMSRKTAMHINLCGNTTNRCDQEIGHGTLCAMVLDHLTSDYELVNIQIFKENRIKVSADIALLSKALKLCQDLKIDIISLSAASSTLSDSRYLYDITLALSKGTIIVSSLENMRCMTVPTSYPHVLGVSSDIVGQLSPGEIARVANDPLGINIYANCDFCLLREHQSGPSNSFAVPVVAGYINELLNQGQSMSEIEAHIKNLPLYPMCEHEEKYYPVRKTDKEIPIVFLADNAIETCVVLMDTLHEKYEVQSTALSLAEGSYDVRIKSVKDIGTIKEDLYFMEHYYKTDMIFMIGEENQLEEIQKNIDLDVKLITRNDRMWIIHETGQESELHSSVPDRLYEILTT